MKTPPGLIIPLAAAVVLLSAVPLRAQTQPGVVVVESREAAIVDSAAQVLNDIMAIPAQGIPRSLLADAQGIAIIPDMLKGGFVVGVRHGRGVAVVRDESGAWRAPFFISVTGGSLGWQIGIQATDLILVFKTKSSIRGLTSGKFTIGGDASAAAGPVGREASAATDAALRAEIYSYSRSRGLFAGVALDGSAIQIDGNANALYYAPTSANPAPPEPGRPQPLPPSAGRLLQTIQKYTAPEGVATPTAALVPVANTAADPALLRRQLIDASQRLYAVLDDNWKRYLALPAEVYSGDRRPPAETLNGSLARFNAVAANPQYHTLAVRAEFQEAYRLLRQYAAVGTASPILALPPPPR